MIPKEHRAAARALQETGVSIAIPYPQPVTVLIAAAARLLKQGLPSFEKHCWDNKLTRCEVKDRFLCLKYSVECITHEEYTLRREIFNPPRRHRNDFK